MKRRRFLKNTLTALPLSGSIITSACQPDMTIDPKSKSIIVIGAGISGLAAAKKLQDKGFNVTVLEAQEKVGGRLRTNRSLGINFDEGQVGYMVPAKPNHYLSPGSWNEHIYYSG